MQWLQEFESIQRPNYNQIACDCERFCQGLHYTVWKKHGETDAPPQADNPLVEILQDEDFNRLVHSYFHDDGVDDIDDDADDDGGGIGGSHGDDIECPMDGDSSDDELDDGYFLDQLLRHTKAEVLVASARG